MNAELESDAQLEIGHVLFIEHGGLIGFLPIEPHFGALRLVPRCNELPTALRVLGSDVRYCLTLLSGFA